VDSDSTSQIRDGWRFASGSVVSRGVAGHEDIRVEEGVGGLHPQFHVGDIDPTGATAHLVAQQCEQVAGDGGVLFGGAGHGEDLASDILVADGRVGLPSQIVIGGNRVDPGEIGHGNSWV
jgi:hypothetical protein